MMKTVAVARNFIGFLTLLAFSAHAGAADLAGLRFGVSSPTQTRLVFDLDGAPDYVISGDDQGSGRLIIEFSTLSVPASYRAAQPGKGHVAAVMFLPALGKERAVVSLARTGRLAKTLFLPPSAPGQKSRLVLDFEDADRAAFLASLPSRFADLTPVIREATAAPAPAATTPADPPARIAETTPQILAPPTASPSAAAPAPILSQPALFPHAEKPVIVIDAGHGGGDPGAAGPSGVLEKSVTLAVALELAQQLEATGRYAVVLTRHRDARLHLEDRSQRARDAGADLFLSLHADAHLDPNVRGASVYTLSEKGEARAVKEVKAKADYEIFGEKVAQSPGAVSDVLIDLAQRFTVNESARFADTLIAKIAATTPLLNNSHRQENLHVLLAPDVPAVLLELGFISNTKDEANLNSVKWRRKMAGAIAEAVNAYFDAPRAANAPAARAAL